eukprot:m.482091 g.482091  ORF g.482091 m.482091 type:complete len:67 (-) comp59022_c0_seq1:96-296(-)
MPATHSVILCLNLEAMRNFEPTTLANPPTARADLWASCEERLNHTRMGHPLPHAVPSIHLTGTLLK